MTLYFCTPGQLHIRNAMTFGMSAKETDSPIGYFGTGLKFAIATLLRTGHHVSITLNDEVGYTQEHYRLVLENVEFRGKTFKRVCLANTGEAESEPVVDLGFTTELGKNWEVWMAYRELESNTRDEKGFTSTHQDSRTAPGTIITVAGDRVMQAYADRDTIFCNGVVLEKNNDLEVRLGHSKYLFYKGVRILTLDKPSVYTYNILRDCSLTEDRTLSHPSLAGWYVAKGLVHFHEQSLVRCILTTGGDTFESTLDFGSAGPGSTDFLMALTASISVATLNRSARKYGAAHGIRGQEVKVNTIEQKQLDKAIGFLLQLGFQVTDYPIKVVELYGGLGEAANGEILIAPKAFRMGTKYVAGTLLEEYIHLKDGVADETRAMQNVLVDTIMSLGEKLVGEPI